MRGYVLLTFILLAASIARAPSAAGAAPDVGLFISGHTTSPGSGVIARIDPVTGEVLSQTITPFRATKLRGVADGKVAVTSLLDHQVVTLNPENWQTVDFFPLGTPYSITSAGETIYVGSQASGMWRIHALARDGTPRHAPAYPLLLSGLPVDQEVGPDGLLYVAAGSSTRRYHPFTAASDSFSISGPRFFTFGPDGNIYTSPSGSSSTMSIVKYSGTTGALLATFASNVPMNAGNLAFGPGGNLYVLDSFAAQIMEYHGTSGSLVRSVPLPIAYQVNDFAFIPIPEPAGVGLMCGTLLLLFQRRRRCESCLSS